MWRFNLAQIDRLSEMIANFSLVMLVSFVLPVFNQQQDLKPLILFWGALVSFSSAVLSLIILKGVNK